MGSQNQPKHGGLHTIAPMSAKRFRIAFSFTGEKRDFVSKVAAILSQRFSEAAILYDKYHEAEFARGDLGIHLPDLYHKESDIVVLVICKDYESKEWCGLEWTAIHALIKERKGENVMLCRFDHALIKGLYSTAGFVELDEKTPEQTATLILERLAINEARPKDYYTKPVSASPTILKTAIPNNLPRIQPFFGREKELAAIREALAPENRIWGALIDGPGGIGKTSIAIRAAYDCSPPQFQRIIFLSAKSREMDEEGERPLTGFILSSLIEMLNELARELGQPDINKSPEDQRIRLLLDALGMAQALIIFDNLESIPKSDRDQLFNFVKHLPQGCKAILTSRRRIGSGSELVQLDKLEEDAALATLADLAKHNKLLVKTNQTERRTLYDKTGGNPLLLHWLAGQLGRGNCRTLSDALQFLSTCPTGNDPLEFIFGDLADEFTPKETRILCALTYFTLPVKVKHLVIITGLSKEQVESPLRSLANRSLVVPDQEEKAYTLIPMVSEFLRRKRPEVIGETGNRVEEHAYALIIENGYEKYARFPILSDAWPMVAPALPLFLTKQNEQIQTVCTALSEFLEFTGHWDELLSLNQQAEAKAIAARDYRIAGRRAYDTGTAYSLRQQTDNMLECADRVEAHMINAQAGARERSLALSLRGHVYELRQDYSSAISSYRKVLELHRSLSAESEDVAIALNDIARIEQLSGNLTTAEQGYCESLLVARAVNSNRSMATATGNLAWLALDRKDWPGAETLAREALPLAENVRHQELIAWDCRILAKALAQLGEKAEGLIYARRAVEIFTQLSSPRLNDAIETLRECEK
jgi:tetratricopeptide (TPR) repeat protein